MKKIILIVILLFLSENSISQWQYIGGNNLGGAKALEYDSSYIFAGSFILTENSTENSGVGVYKSSDNGDNWILTSLTKSIVYLYLNNNRLFACTDNEGIYYSDNDGVNWNLINFGGDLSVLTSNSSYLFGGGISYTYSSTNNGINWTNILPQQSQILLSKDNLIFAASGYSLKISSNNGFNWVTSSVDNKPIYSLATNGSYIFAGTFNGLYKSSDNGINWTITSLNNIYWVVSILAFDSNLIISDYRGNGIYKSTDLGLTWTQKNEGLGSSITIDVLMKKDEYAFASGPIGLYRRSLQNILNINNINSEIPDKYFLSQNYPNPFNPSTTIGFQIKDSRFVKLMVYDILGKEVATLVNERLKPGEYEVQFSNEQMYNVQLSSGVYYYSLYADGKLIETKKMVMIK